MIVNLDTPINTLKGEQITQDGTPLTVGNVVISALDNARGGDNLLLFRLAGRCVAGGNVDFSDDELAIMREATTLLASNFIAAQIIAALTPPAVVLE